ncbi:MAG TPA: cysteine desulfurase family protein [Candidatus Saccharimonadales bacterium]
MIYLDYAAATPVDPDVLAAMQPFFSEQFYNPSATYGAALEVKKSLDASRAEVAHWLGARPSEVIFTAGGTEANNLAIHGIMRQYPESNVVVSAIEHESVLAPAHKYDCHEVAVIPDGRIDIEAFRKAINEHTVLVSIMYANNEIGTIQPIRELSRIIEEVRAERRKKGNKLPLYFHTDACQAANYLDLHVARLGVDLLTLNGGKIYGPKQSGVLYVKGGIKLKPLVDGGGQEFNVRSGTENVPAAIGLAAALQKVQPNRHAEVKRLHDLQRMFIKMIEKNFPEAIINGSRKQRLPNNVHVTFPGQDNERLLIQLDEAGIMAAAGSACSASNEEPSHVLRALGVSEQDAQASLRFTMGQATTEAAIAKTLDTLQKSLS